jgi:methylamine dehydrogenase heavy chain
MSRTRSSLYVASRAALAALLLLGAAAAVRAELPSDTDKGPSVTVLGEPTKHWVWVNDLVFPHMSDGMAMLIDGDTGRYLGTLSTGWGFVRVLLPKAGQLIYSPEIYFSRGTRGGRTDVVTIYDAHTLSPVKEIQIPPKRSANMPMMANAVLTDDDRYMLIYNFTPAQSVSVVDMKSQAFVREVETPGCALVYPTGPRTFFSICGDGALSLAQIDDSGNVTLTRSAPVFSPAKDPVTEKAVRIGKTWYFVSYEGQIHPVKAAASDASVEAAWWLTSEAERKQGWRPGGLQQLAVDSHSHLYAIMHRGGPETHKDPGKDVWVYDIATHQRVKQIALSNLASSIQLTTDDKPLLFSIFIDKPVLDIYDAADGRLLRSVDQVGTTPALLVTP